jgi:AcrR family transcriptional regulator
MRIGMGGTTGGTAPRAGRPRDPRLDEAIVAATVELLTERGYHDTTLAAVAARAGTTTAAIYRRWSSKSELVAKAVFRTDGDDVVADTGDIAADLATMVRWSVEKLARPAALAAIAGLLGEPRDDRRDRVADASVAVDLTTERLRRAQADGELRADVDPEVLASLIDGPVMHAVLSGTADRVDERWIADLVAVVLDGARPGSGLQYLQSRQPPPQPQRRRQHDSEPDAPAEARPPRNAGRRRTPARPSPDAPSRSRARPDTNEVTAR